MIRYYVLGRISEENVKSMVFHLNDVVRCSAIDTDLDYATKGYKCSFIDCTD
jgi:hypothetical protein